jgi:hypothetical protein
LAAAVGIRAGKIFHRLGQRQRSSPTIAVTTDSKRFST